MEGVLRFGSGLHGMSPTKSGVEGIRLTFMAFCGACIVTFLVCQDIRSGSLQGLDYWTGRIELVELISEA